MFAVSLMQGLVHLLEATNLATFWAHIVQSMVDSTGALLDSILKFRLTKAHPYLIRLLSATQTLIHASPRDIKALQPYLFRLIAARMQHDPDLTWQEMDAQLVSMLDSAFQDSVLTGDYLDSGTLAVEVLATMEQNVRTLLRVTALRLKFV
jgi:hypothetical protein